jgi:hypothetical protein
MESAIYRQLEGFWATISVGLKWLSTTDFPEARLSILIRRTDSFRFARHPGRTQEIPAQQFFFFGEASDAISCIPMI